MLKGEFRKWLKRTNPKRLTQAKAMDETLLVVRGVEQRLGVAVGVMILPASLAVILKFISER